jgi:hypothetical protein
MKKFSTIDICRINLANLALGRDKETFDKRLDFTMDEVYESIDNMYDIGDRLQALSALQCLKECEKHVFSIPVEADTNSSMILIMGLITRDIESLEYVGVGCSAPQRTYNKLETAFREDCSKEGVELPDTLEDFKHNGVIPYGYAGDSCIRRLIGKKAFKVWEKTYKRCLPSCALYREACLEAWNSGAFCYEWELPDGFQVATPVLGDPHEFEVSLPKMTLKYNLRENEPRPKFVEKKNARGETLVYRNPETKALGANTIHSLDRYILSEIVRRCDMTKGRALAILEKCKNSKETIKGYHPELERLESCAMEMGIISARWFYLLEDEPVQLSDSLMRGLTRLANTLGNKSFELMVIHDAFGCTANHVNYLRRTANQVFADIYAGDMMKYFARQLGINVPVAKFDKAVYEAILDSDYLVH